MMESLLIGRILRIPAAIMAAVRSGAFLVLVGVVLAAGCGRARQPNVAPGEERVFRKTPPVEARAGGSAERSKEDETVSEDEFGRRNLVRQIEAQFKNAKSGDDILDALGNLEKVLNSLKGRAPELVPYVARCLTDQDPDQRIYGIRARAAISPKDALPDLKLVLRDADPKVRQAAIEAFQMLPDPLPFDVLFTHLAGEREAVVQQATTLVIAARGTDVEALRLLDAVLALDVKAVGPVIDLARKFPAASRQKADQLAYFLDRNDADLRLQVAKLLGEWATRTPAVVSGLVRALNDPEISVRKAAFTALKSFSTQEFGYNPESDAAARQEALQRWKAWARQVATDGRSAEDGAASAPVKD
jgi:hypothetical protein